MSFSLICTASTFWEWWFFIRIRTVLLTWSSGFNIEQLFLWNYNSAYIAIDSLRSPFLILSAHFKKAKHICRNMLSSLTLPNPTRSVHICIYLRTFSWFVWYKCTVKYTSPMHPMGNGFSVLLCQITFALDVFLATSQVNVWRAHGWKITER